MTDPYSQRLYLLGSPTFAHGGLIDRVKARLEEISTGGYLPNGWDEASVPLTRYKGSIIGAGSNSYDEEGIESVWELCLSLSEWLAGHPSNPKAARDLAAWLRKHHRADSEHITESLLPRLRAEIARTHPDDATAHVEERHVDRADELIGILKAFTGACEHDWQELPSEDARIRVFECSKTNCGARKQKGQGETWIAV